jgi:hypothetical protein
MKTNKLEIPLVPIVVGIIVGIIVYSITKE